MKKTTFIVCLAFLISACVSTQSVSWPTGTSEGSIDLPANTNSVALVSRAKVAYAPPHPDVKRNYPNEIDAVGGLLTGFYNEIYNRHYLTFKGTGYMFQDIASQGFLPALELGQIQSASKSADILVSLDMFDQFYEDTYTIEIRKQKEEGNTYREVDYIVGKRNMQVTTGWRVYNVKSGEVIDSFEIYEQYFYEAEDLDRIRVTELLDANLKKEFRNLGLRIGHTYAGRVSPTKHFTHRSIYDRGSDDLENAASKIRDDQWPDAADIWTFALKSESNDKRKAMLYHNLAIYMERSGDLVQAKEYAKLAANHHKLGIQTQKLIGF